MPLRARGADRTGIFSGNRAEQAIIDIGSNTVRLVVYGGTLRAPTVLLNEKVTPRLGQDIATTGRLPQESIDIALRGLKRFVLLLEELEVEDIDAVATAAVREAENGPEFIAMVEQLGLSPRVISGEEEARVSANGVIGAFPGAAGVVADLGGGSLELVRIGNGDVDHPTSLPLGTLRLPSYRVGSVTDTRKAIEKQLKKGGWNEKQDGPLYLVGGTWRAMAVFAMQERNYPLTDPHGFELDAKNAMKLARKLAGLDPAKLEAIDRITGLRAWSLPDAAILLQAMLKRLAPSGVVFSSWGLREGLLYDRLPKHEKLQDPLLAGAAIFAAQRGAPLVLATRIAGWTVNAIPADARGAERLRIAATMLALASMRIEPNLRTRHAMDWALHKRWIGLDARGRAMLAMAISANGNHCEIPGELVELADREALEEAICWGLATRVARRIGARSRRSLQVSRIGIEQDKLVLNLQASHADLFGIANEKDMKLLADRLGLPWEVRITPDEKWHAEESEVA